MAWCKGLVANGTKAQEAEPASDMDAFTGGNEFLD